MLKDLIKNNIREIPDFPSEGIRFKDITPLIENPLIFNKIIEAFYEQIKDLEPEIIVGIESRGFIFAAPLAAKMRIPLVLARKSGKLPFTKVSVEFNLEYGTDKLEMHIDSIKNSQKVIIVDDVLATGGTAEAAIKLVKKLKGKVIGLAFIIELLELKGQEKINPIKKVSLFKE
jgi:adenine phosphoribosyltransferase